MPISSRRLLRQRSIRLSAATHQEQGVLPEPHTSPQHLQSSSSPSSSSFSLSTDESSTIAVQSTPTTKQQQPQTKKKHVSFDQVHVRSYSLVMGDHPYCATGCPLSLDWTYQPQVSQSLYDYELQHERRGLVRSTCHERHARLLDQQQQHQNNDAEQRDDDSPTAVVDSRQLRHACRRQARCRDRRIQQAEQVAFFQH